MNFNSIEFLIFFPVALIIYMILSARQRQYFLLISSYIFYMYWKIEYSLLILTSTAICYYAARMMEEAPNKRKILLFVSISTNLLILLFFKYFNFISETIHQIIHFGNSDRDPIVLKVLLPVGISFYTFQSLSYIIDVFRGHKKAEKDFILFALFVSFFPQLVAGPIEKSTRLLPQLSNLEKVTFRNFTAGMRMVILGMFKKVVIADRLAIYVNEIFSTPKEFGSVHLIIASYFFAIQIYCDFAGYSDIAVGTARIFGIHLIKNFNRPYFASSLTDFWRRWHISLTSWFKDYLYIPIGGNRKSAFRTFANVLFVFIVSGLWHGAHLKFLLWGFFHGILQIIDKIITGKGKDNKDEFMLLRIFRQFATFNIVALLWIFFRANSIQDAFIILKKIFCVSDLSIKNVFDSLGNYEAMIGIVSIGILFILEFLQKDKDFIGYASTLPRVERWVLYYFLTISIIVFGVFGVTEFIYFQF